MINVLKASAPIISMCSLHVIRLSKITPLHTSEPFSSPFNAFGAHRIENTAQNSPLLLRASLLMWQRRASSI
jgi:hypothetical protein